MSEKLDGVRAYWDGANLVSRQGNVFAAPSWFTDQLPDTPLDGELSMGPGTFDATSAVVRRAKPHDGWRELTYHVFDAPGHQGPYEQRQKFLEREVAKSRSQFLVKTPVEKIRSRAHLEERLRGASYGVVIVRPGSTYTPRRTDCCILKGKPPRNSRRQRASGKRRPSRSKKRRAATKRRLTSFP
jgi:DNA ligase-1